MFVKIYEYHIKKDKEELFLGIQEKVVQIYNHYLNCEVMYLKSMDDETMWMEFSTYCSEEEYVNAIGKINHNPVIAQLFEQFESCLVPEKQSIKEGNFLIKSTMFLGSESKEEANRVGEILRVGTIYIPVSHVEISSKWYVNKLGAKLSYKDQDKAILNYANQSIFLVKSKENQSANFYDIYDNERFSVTFEVNGLQALDAIHREFSNKQIRVGPIEDRGHSGRNFVFYDLDGNKFDVWSELSPVFKEKYLNLE